MILLWRYAIIKINSYDLNYYTDNANIQLSRREKRMTEDKKITGNNDIILLGRELKKVIFGKDDRIALLLCALLAGGHVLIEDIPGVGKTTLARALALSSGLEYKRIQFTPDVTASDITGCSIYNRRTESFEFKSGAVMTNVLLADEINRASPKTQSSLLEAMAEGGATVDGVKYMLPVPFMVIATQNPIGYVGTHPLPEAQLDRFMLRFSLGYPDYKNELCIAMNKSGSNSILAINAVTDSRRIQELRQATESVHCDDSIYEYIVTLVAATRNNCDFLLGASPRASVDLPKLCRALAFINGRNYVLPSDVWDMFVPAISHRVVLSPTAESEGKTAAASLNSLLKTVEQPHFGKSR